MQYADSEKRFVAVLRRDISPERLLNALGHATAGLVATAVPPAVAEFVDYADHAGVTARLSTYPFILLQAKNTGQLKRCRDELIAAELPTNWFAAQMIGTSAAEQIARTRAATADELELWLVVTFGSAERLTPITKRFSLFRAGGEAARPSSADDAAP